MKNIKFIFVIISIFFISSCRRPESHTGVDQCQRQEIFKDCMGRLPAGPVKTRYNDWDEVVSQCDRVAFNQSLKPLTNIKPECRAESTW